MKTAARGLALGLLFLAVAWAIAALAIDAPRSLGSPLAAAAALAGLAVLVFLRPFWRRALGLVAIFVGVLLWWLSLEARNDRSWQHDVLKLPRASVAGDRLTIENVRDFHYRADGDYDEHWETRTWDLSKLRGVDVFLSHWGSPWIAHTIVSFDFEGQPPLAVSIETRKEQGESYSAILGFFRQYELYYVVSDERDVIGVRTNHRDEDTYLYRVRMPLPRVREVLLDYAGDMNRLADAPRWYNAATTNCTTVIRQHVQHVGGSNPWDWRILVNGKVDELMYERGTINGSRPFPEIRAASAISARAREAGDPPDFWQRIRQGLPPRPSS